MPFVIKLLGPNSTCELHLNKCDDVLILFGILRIGFGGWLVSQQNYSYILNLCKYSNSSVRKMARCVITRAKYVISSTQPPFWICHLGILNFSKTS